MQKEQNSNKTELEKLLQDVSHPIIGLSYVIELYKDSPKPKIYKCILCNLNYEPITIVAHLKGKSHKLNYMRVHKDSEYQKLKSKDLTNTELKKYLNKWAAGIQVQEAAPFSASLSRGRTCISDSAPSIPSSSEKNIDHQPAQSSTSEQLDENLIRNEEDLETVYKAIDLLTESVVRHHIRALPEEFKKVTIKRFMGNRNNLIEEQIKCAKKFYLEVLEKINKYVSNKKEPCSPSSPPPPTNVSSPDGRSPEVVCIDLTNEDEDMTSISEQSSPEDSQTATTCSGKRKLTEQSPKPAQSEAKKPKPIRFTIKSKTTRVGPPPEDFAEESEDEEEESRRFSSSLNALLKFARKSSTAALASKIS